MKMRIKVIACMVFLAVLVAAPSALAQAEELIGVWKATEISFTDPSTQTILQPQSDLLLFTKRYYSEVTEYGDKPRPVRSLEKATNAQKVAVWEPFNAEAGTYEVKGTTITFHTLVAKDPEDMKLGVFTTCDFKIDAKTLSFTCKSTEKGFYPNPIQIKLTRLE